MRGSPVCWWLVAISPKCSNSCRRGCIDAQALPIAPNGLKVRKPEQLTTISLQRSVMFTELPTTTIAHAIQLAVAPVFLLTGVASILSVLTNRLARIIDRSRFLHSKLLSIKREKQDKEIHDELAVLSQRTRFINWAIGLCTTCVLLICSVIAILFLGSFVLLNMATPIASLFVAAMLSLIMALIFFICEIYLATANVRNGP